MYTYGKVCERQKQKNDNIKKGIAQLRLSKELVGNFLVTLVDSLLKREICAEKRKRFFIGANIRVY